MGHRKAPCGTQATAPGHKHVIWIWIENHSYNTIIGSSQAPYINSLATECGLATNYHNGSAEQLLGLPALGKAASFPTMTSAFNL